MSTAFDFLRVNPRSSKPRIRGLTEIRGPYYTVFGKRYLSEVSSGFISVPADDLLRLAERVRALGMKVKPEVGIQFGAGGGSDVSQLEREGTRHVSHAIALARRYLDAGADLIMIESEGITENVRSWQLEAVASLVDAIGLDHIMFEAAAPDVFTWYVKTYGAEVNLFIDHSQILHLESLRQGIWGTADVWGRIARYESTDENDA